MRFGTRAVPIAALVATLLLPAACGGASEPSMRATLTDDGCTYEGDTTPAAGMFTINVENHTDLFGAFALSRLADGKTVDDLTPHLAQIQQEFDETGTLPEPPFPDFYEQIVRGGAQAGEATFLPADVPAGTYALMCFVDNLPTFRVYAAAQLDVS